MSYLLCTVTSIEYVCISISPTPLSPIKTTAVIGKFVEHSGTFIRSSPNDNIIAL